MKLEDIFLARFAELGPDGLFTVVGGGVTRINADGFPWAWGMLFLVVRIRLSTDEASTVHTTAVEQEAPNGKIEPLATPSPMVPLSPTAEIGPDGRVGLTCTLCLVNLIFPEPGVYKYRFKIDGQEFGTTEILVAGPVEGGQGR